MSVGFYYVSDIQDCFEYIIIKHETIPDHFHVQIYVNKIKNGIVFEIKTGYKLELLSEETMQLLGSSKRDTDQNKDGKIVPKLETVEVVLVHDNLVNNNYYYKYITSITSITSITYFSNKQTILLINYYYTSFTNNAKNN